MKEDMRCRTRSRDGVRRAHDGSQEYIVHVCHVTGFPQSFPSTLTEGIQTVKTESFTEPLKMSVYGHPAMKGVEDAKRTRFAYELVCKHEPMNGTDLGRMGN